jgi:glycosyltransferase involved in cell wall biosynthesis
MKICSPQLGLSPESNSGGEVYDREVITRLCRAGVQVHSLLPKNRPYPAEKNLLVRYAWLQPMVPPHIFSLFVFPYLLKTYRQQKFALIRVHNPYFVGPAAVSFKELFPQVPLVASYLHLEEGINHLIDKLVVKHFDQIITISQSTKREIVQRLDYPSAKIAVAYPGINHRFQPGPKPKKLLRRFNLTDQVILMFLGGLKPRKNPLFLLEVLRYLNQANVCLIFAGSGPLLPQLKQKTEKLGLSPRVRFTGFVPESEKVEYYRLADALLMPSLKEGFGMPVTEAAACAKPAVVANNSSLPELILPGKTGFIAKTNRVDPWTEVLLQLIKSKGLRQKMGQTAQKYARQQFSWDKNIAIHLKIFNQLISS